MTQRRSSATRRRTAIRAAALAATATLAATAAAAALRGRRVVPAPLAPDTGTPPAAYAGNRAAWYRAPVSTWWWLSRPSYVAFILREVSCVFVAWSILFLLLLIRAVGAGQSSYVDFLDWAGTPWVMVLNVVTFAFLLYHAVTWFQLTPAAVVVRLGGRRLPGVAIAAPAYAAWLGVSVLVAWLLLRA